MPQTIIAPVINSNGTAREDLVIGYTDAVEALSKAYAALLAVRPHSRDYPSIEVCLDAILQHRERLNHLCHIRADMMQLAQAVMRRIPA